MFIDFKGLLILSTLMKTEDKQEVNQKHGQSYSITKTCLYNFDPLQPQFNTVKLGFTGVYISSLISAQKHRLWVLVRTALLRQF